VIMDVLAHFSIPKNIKHFPEVLKHIEPLIIKHYKRSDSDKSTLLIMKRLVEQQVSKAVIKEMIELLKLHEMVEFNLY